MLNFEKKKIWSNNYGKMAKYIVRKYFKPRQKNV